MSYPFPGMNPWLEHPWLWRDVHHTLISAIRDDLAPRLRPRYFVAIELTTYVSQLPVISPRIRYPDVMVVEQGGPALVAPAVATADPYLTVDLPVEDIEVAYLEVRQVPSGEVVTVIEVLSPTNKQPGEDRETYIKKRREILATDVSFVEIDLLRAWPPMPYTDTQASDYRIFVRRRDHYTQAHVYSFSVRQPIPRFPLPLLPGDTEPIVDLGALLHAAYDRAGYDIILQYNQPPVPPLSSEDAAWAAQLLEQPRKVEEEDNEYHER
jgi:hypothetical protein